MPLSGDRRERARTIEGRAAAPYHRLQGEGRLATNPERDALIARLESEARADPAGYRRRVALLAALGYGHIGLGLLVALALVAGMIAFLVWNRGRGIGFLLKLFIPALVFTFALVRGLWVRFPPPQGIRLETDAFPALSRLVEEARVQAAAPPRNYLLLGLPLLDGLTLDEMRAVLAHELGHLSGRDGALGSWIYRSRAAWARLVEQLQHEDHVGTAVLGRFLAWYQPYFDAYSFVAARAQALGDVYWRGLYRRADSSPTPEGRPFLGLADALPSAVEAGQPAASLELALAAPTTHEDTHLCLRERLDALGERPRVPLPAPQPPSTVLLGSARDVLAGRLDEFWVGRIREWWSERYESTQRARTRLARIDADGGPPADDAAKALDLGLLREQTQGADAPSRTSGPRSTLTPPTVRSASRWLASCSRATGRRASTFSSPSSKLLGSRRARPPPRERLLSSTGPCGGGAGTCCRPSSGRGSTPEAPLTAREP